MCIVAPSESGHGGRFEPCEECKRLQEENAALKRYNEDLTRAKAGLISMRDAYRKENAALRQERDRLARIVEKADALAGFLDKQSLGDETIKRLIAYQEARHG